MAADPPPDVDETRKRSPRRLLSGRLSSVRARATLVGMVVVAAALTIGALGLLSLLRTSMTEGVETNARSQLNDVSSLLQLGQLPAQLPSARGDTFTQVVSSNGTVLASSATLLASTPISHLHPGEEGTVVGTVPTLTESGGADTDGPYLLLARTLNGPPGSPIRGPVTVYVAATLHQVHVATATVGLALSGGLPVLVILVGGLIWIFAGRALRPVEAIRAEVADITGRDLHRRVPEPSTHDEVANLARTMNRMLDRLETSAAAQRRFVGDASHELRSPLTALQTTLEIAMAHPSDGSLAAAAADALDESRRLQQLLDDLLVLATNDEASRSNGGERKEEVDLDEIILRDARHRRATSSVVIDLHRVSAGRVRGDPNQLARAVRNLMDNAQRHAASRVSVELSTRGGRVVLAIQDDGPGILPAERDRVFERFARLDEARTQDAGGAGLGLAIVKEIVERHHGTVAVADSAGGARFEVVLPAIEVDGPDDK